MAIYVLEEISTRLDGSGMIDWHISARANEGYLIPKSTIISTPYEDVQTALASPTPAAALKQLLLDNAPAEWLPAYLDTEEATNKDVEQVALDLINFIGEFPKDIN